MEGKNNIMRVVFVYNANSGKLNALMDAGHKLLSPSTYSCRLCTLTYDTFTEKSIWKSFRNETQIFMDFYHKDEFEVQFPKIKHIYPTILKLEGSQLTTVLTNEDLERISDVKQLIERLKLKLNN